MRERGASGGSKTKRIKSSQTRTGGKRNLISTARELQSGVRQAEIHESGPFVGRVFSQDLPEAGAGLVILGKQQKVAAAAGA